MALFDVISLFPSVPIDVALKYVEDLLVINNIDKISSGIYAIDLFMHVSELFPK